MRIYYIITLIFLSGIAHAQIVNIPDANFKTALLNHSPVIDTNGDGEIQVSEAEVVLKLHLEHKQIASLEGVQNFINLEDLNCHGNALTILDISQNQNLKKLRCSWNQLTNLDISQTLNLESLVVYHNELTDIDVSEHFYLEVLSVSNNPLTVLDVTNNPNLKNLSCNDAQLTSLDVSQNLNLTSLGISDNDFTNIDLSNNSKLISLGCSRTQLTNLDLSNNPSLFTLTCTSNTTLITLNIKNGNNINMPYMDAEFNPNLQCIEVDDVTVANARHCYRGDPMVGWCKDATAMYSEDCVLGVAEVSKDSFNLYPNPTNGILNIQTTYNPDLIKIYSIQDILVKETQESSIDVSNLASGLYFVKVSTQGKSIIKKFIKY